MDARIFSPVKALLLSGPFDYGSGSFFSFFFLQKDTVTRLRGEALMETSEALFFCEIAPLGGFSLFEEMHP